MSQDAADSTSALLWTIPARNNAIALCRDVSLSPVFGSVNIRTQPKESNAARILSAARKRGTRRTRSWSVRCRSRTDVRSRRSAVPSVCCRKGNTRNRAGRVDPVFTEAKCNGAFKKGVEYGAVPVYRATTLGLLPRAPCRSASAKPTMSASER